MTFTHQNLLGTKRHSEFSVLESVFLKERHDMLVGKPLGSGNEIPRRFPGQIILQSGAELAGILQDTFPAEYLENSDPSFPREKTDCEQSAVASPRHPGRPVISLALLY